jgi:hypothetical protein
MTICDVCNRLGVPLSNLSCNLTLRITIQSIGATASSIKFSLVDCNRMSFVRRASKTTHNSGPKISQIYARLFFLFCHFSVECQRQSIHFGTFHWTWEHHPAPKWAMAALTAVVPEAAALLEPAASAKTPCRPQRRWLIVWNGSPAQNTWDRRPKSNARVVLVIRSRPSS